ncbi:MAG: ribonuclease III [Gammaproteobacteria bacterium]
MSFKQLDYTFKNKGLLETALTHRSLGQYNYERLEFLGDSILGFVITENLFLTFPKEPEGILTILRASLVNKESLAKLARVLELGEHIRLGAGERKSGGWRRDSILANTMEAIIGAVYLDSDFSQCKQFILSLYQDMLNELDVDNITKDPKTVLQELLQSRKMSLPVYKVIAENGEAHKLIFTVSCEISELEQEVQAEGKSKRIAEQSAANKALKLIDKKH